MSEEFHQRLDQATTKRLSQLGTRPLDTARLERKLEAALQDEAHSSQRLSSDLPSRNQMQIMRWLRPVAGLAAVLTLVIGLLFTLDLGTPRASAAVLELSTLHHELITGRLEVTPVINIEEANALLAAQQASAPTLPDGLDEATVQSCCLVDVQGRLAAVAVLQEGDVLITLVVAQAPDFAHEMGDRIDIDGRRFFGHELDGVRMMMANRGDRWLCVMGDASYEALARIASEARF